VHLISPLQRHDIIHTTVEARLRLDEKRYTSGRRQLVDLLAGSRHPLSISEIGAALPDLPRSSAYRSLVELQEAGLVRRLSANDEFARFELAEELTEHHHHLLCLQCGRVIDVDASHEFEVAVATTVAALSREYGFTAHDHRLDVLGICRVCTAS
jgi:Fur family ferric uptake transcriptional regulator